MLQRALTVSGGGGSTINPVSVVEDLTLGSWKTETFTCVVGKSYVINALYEGSTTPSIAFTISSGGTSLLQFKTANSSSTKIVMSMIFKATSTSVTITNNANSNLSGKSIVSID